jgi:hypothetical protein
MLELLKKDWPQDLVDVMADLEDLNERYHEARRRAEFLVESITNAKRITINPSFGQIFVSTESHAQQIARLSARIRELEAALPV